MDILATVLTVSKAILIIWGAICMILLLVWLLILISIAARVNAFVSDIKMKYEMIQNFVLIPLQFIMQLLDRWTTPTEKSSPTTRKKR